MSVYEGLWDSFVFYFLCCVMRVLPAGGGGSRKTYVCIYTDVLTTRIQAWMHKGTDNQIFNPFNLSKQQNELEYIRRLWSWSCAFWERRDEVQLRDNLIIINWLERQGRVHFSKRHSSEKQPVLLITTYWINRHRDAALWNRLGTQLTVVKIFNESSEYFHN